jgi:peptide/nickel transport system permease protein
MAPLERLRAPSPSHPLGTDSFGRDVLSRMIFGARVSLPVALFVVVVLSTIGVTVGLVTGFYGGLTDTVLMRVVDTMMSIPDLVMILTVIGLFGRGGLLKTMLIIALTSWMGMARLVRGQVLVARTLDYVLAARALGGSDLRIVRCHILPAVAGVITVNATLWVAIAIVLESSLSYLGLGVQPPTPSWGNMLNEGRRYMHEAWWLTVFPGLAIFLTAMAFNVVGDWLRDWMDPRSLGKRAVVSRQP